MNQNVKDIYKGFMTTFCRPEDVIFGESPKIGDSTLRLIKDDTSENFSCTPFQAGEALGTILSRYDSLPKICKVYVESMGDRHIVKIGEIAVRYRMNVVLEKVND